MSSEKSVASSLEDVNEPQSEFDTGCFTLRYLVIFVVCVGGLLSSAMITCIQPSIIPLRKVDFTACNTSNKDQSMDFEWGKKENLFTTIHLWAQLLMCFPSVWITQRFGGKYILEYSVCISGMLTLLVPESFEQGYYNFLVLRFVIGLVLSLVIPATINLAINWIPKNEKHHLITLLTLSDTLTPIFVPPITTYFFTSRNDKSVHLVFYVFGISSIAWSILCMTTVKDVSKNKWVSKHEKKILLEQNICENNEKNQYIPWVHIVKPRLNILPPLALLTALFLSSISQFVLQITLASLTSQILDISAQDIAFVLALPFVIQLIVAVICSLIADWTLAKKLMSITKIRMLTAFVSQKVNTCCFIILATIDCHSWISLALLNLMVITAGINKTGTEINFIDLAPSYAGSLFAVCNSAKIAGNIVTVYVIFEYFQDTMFHIAAGTIFLSTVVFIAFGSARKQTWANK